MVGIMILVKHQALRILKQAQQHYMVRMITPTTKEMCMHIYTLLVQEGFHSIVSADSVITFNTDQSTTIITKSIDWSIERVTTNERI